MIPRRTFVAGMAAMMAAPLAAGAQRPSKAWRVGYLSMATTEGDKSWVAEFRQGMRDLGYVEGQNVLIDVRHAEQRPERVPDLVTEFVRWQADVLVVYGALELAAKKASAIPIVFTVHPDPVGAGLVASLARPGGNATGLSDSHSELIPKRIEMLKSVVPAASTIGVLLNSKTPNAALQFRAVQPIATRLGLAVIPFEVREPGDLEPAFTRINRERPDIVLAIPDPSWALGQQKRIADLALKNRVPLMGTLRLFADAGCLMSYGADFHELWRRSATYVDRILKGAKPGELPIEQPTRFEMVINLKTARALGVTIPPSLVLRADQVIE